MFKYRVRFKTEVQVDGFSDWRDYEVKPIAETVTVKAKNLKHARKIACKEAYGYSNHGRFGYAHHKWYDGEIVSVKRVYKRV